MAIIHGAPWKVETLETRNLEQKCIHRVDVNTSFPDMWEGGGKQLLLNDILHFFTFVITQIEEELEDCRCRTAGMDGARKHPPTFIHSQME